MTSLPEKRARSAPPEEEKPEKTRAEAYERGLRRAVGRVALAWSPALHGSLELAIAGHARSRETGQPHDGPKVLRWLELAGEEFGAWLGDHPDEARFYSAGEPRGFLRWLNEEEQRRQARDADGTAKTRRA